MQPTSEAAVRQAVAEAVAARTPLAITGGGTRRAAARPVQSAATLDMAALSGITLHEPSEMVIGARAGTPLAEVEAALAAHDQLLAFEPADWRAALGTTGTPTIGGVVAANVSGPRRVLAGAARDSLIGVRFVNGRGEIVRNGGRVMKNVTGLDLVKLQAGAWGTLGVLTEVVFKVIPRPPRGRTLAIDGLPDAEAVALMGRAMGTPFEVNGAAHAPAGMLGPDARTLLRLEGFPEQLDHRIPALRAALGTGGTVVEGEEHAALWAAVRDLSPFSVADAEAAPALWRISCPAMAGAAIVAEVARTRPVRALYDWSGGLVWLEAPQEDQASADIIRAACAPHSGAHATLMRAPAALKASAPVFQPLPDAHLALTRRIKASLDPQGLLNPGALYPGV